MRNTVLMTSAGALLTLAGGATSVQATLTCNILVDGTSVATCPASITGSIAFSGADAPLFSAISLTGEGSPTLPQPDLSTVTLDVTAATTFSGTHTLDVDIFQTGVAASVGAQLQSTATINNLIGLPGPTTLADFINGTATTLGTTLRSATFPAEANGTAGPFVDTLTVPLTADAHQFAITFTAPDQSANDTIQLEGITSIPVREPGSLALLGAALIGMMAAVRMKQAGR